ncbi:integrase family protein [Microvenator marinus]|uniref:Integrase family protein n=1 Tax=Microvenator marinus TaxID=2600177 RepID=A0A5B8XQS3_9DELT|nr:integrase family protein [Microvenator marinus]QED28252.1 integrase family protein [Microvenator marinus]
MGEVVKLKTGKPEKQTYRLNKSFVDKAEKLPKDRDFTAYFDDLIPGFHLRVLTSCKTFSYWYRSPIDRRARVMKLGRHGDITATEARKKAEKARGAVLDGRDPQEQKDRAKMRSKTFADIADQWLEEYAEPSRKTWKEDKRRLSSPYLKRLQKFQFHEHNREKLQDLLALAHKSASESTPVEANRIVELVNQMLNTACRYRWISSVYRNIAADIQKNTEKGREDYLRATEFAKFADVVGTLPRKHRCSIWFLVLTGCRSKSEALALLKADVHLEAGVFKFRDTKNATDHELPISTGIKTIFEMMPEHRGDTVFMGKELRRPFETIREAGFIDHMTPHALRHTLRSHARSTLNINLEAVDSITNHKSNYGAGARYVHTDPERVLEALEKYQAWVFDKAGIVDFGAYLKTGKR